MSREDASELIVDPDRLRARLAKARSRIGLDTEFIRERTWWPHLALVQIALDDADASILLIDPLAPGIPAALAPILADAGVLKIMHSASEDLVALKHACGEVPRPLFDTQIAAALTGLDAGMGYQRIVLETLGIVLTKGETRSDWMRRPLSPSQLEYASDDVRYLFALHDSLDTRLQTLKRRSWLDEDCARLADNARNDELERWPQRTLRATQFLDADAQCRLLRLLRWRDAYARDHDRPRGWILDNELATALARDPPINRIALQRLLDTTPKAPRNLGDAVWQALETPLADENETPPMRISEVDKGLLRKLQDAVAAASAELGLPEGVLASRRWLHSLLDAQSTTDSAGDSHWPVALSGWRRALLEPRLVPVLLQATTQLSVAQQPQPLQSPAGDNPDASV